jgi:GntR family transcriptional regulator
MQLDPGNEKPIFLQLAEAVEDNILKGVYPEETQVPSTNEVAVTLKVNPATANRAVNLLVDEGIIYKKRGLGMFVSTGARQKILTRRRQAFYQKFLLPLLEEASSIGLSRTDVIGMLNQADPTALEERSSQNEHD